MMKPKKKPKQNKQIENGNAQDAGKKRSVCDDEYLDEIESDGEKNQ